MSEDKKPVVATVSDLRAAYPQLAQSIEAQATEEGKKAGRAEGSIAERERIQAVESHSMPGHEALVQALKFDGKTTGPEAAVQILGAEKALRGNRHAALVADAPKPVQPVEEEKSEPTPKTADDLTKQIMKRDGIAYKAAAFKASKENPGLFQNR